MNHRLETLEEIARLELQMQAELREVWTAYMAHRQRIATRYQPRFDRLVAQLKQPCVVDKSARRRLDVA